MAKLSNFTEFKRKLSHFTMVAIWAALAWVFTSISNSKENIFYVEKKQALLIQQVKYQQSLLENCVNKDVYEVEKLILRMQCQKLIELNK